MEKVLQELFWAHFSWAPIPLNGTKINLDTAMKESVAYPVVQFKGHKKGFFLSVKEYVKVLNYLDSNGLCRI